MQDLKTVRQILFPARNKWYDIGVELGLEVPFLDAIRSNHRGVPPDCLTSMLANYLKRFYPRPTWEDLAAALKQITVAEHQIAKMIDDTEYTGNTTTVSDDAYSR